MKRIVASVGLVALGAASVQSLHAEPFGVDVDRPWSISAALRGFYDDNVNTAGSGEIETFGFQVAPSINVGIQTDQTRASLGYTFDFKWYDKKPDPNRNRHYDITHTIMANLTHAFTERTSVTLADTFVIGQEPTTTRELVYVEKPQHISGDNIRNYGTIAVNHQFTEKFGVEVGYANTYVDYDNEGAFVDPFGTIFTSHSGLLDRIEHAVHADARWTVQPKTIALVGYMYSFVDYTGDELIGNAAGIPIFSEDRNSRSHYGYVGVDHTFVPELVGSLRAGARASEYYNSPEEETDIGPYAMASLRYSYAPGSHLEVGASHDRHATDMFSVSGTSITTDASYTSAYIGAIHQIFPDLTGHASFTFQNAQFNGGAFDDSCEQYYIFNIGLEYQINRHLSATVSYNFDKLDSDLREYERNRIFAGVNFVY